LATLLSHAWADRDWLDTPKPQGADMAEPTESLSASIDTLSRFLVGEQTMGETLLRVAQLAEAAVGADLTGVTLVNSEGHPTTAVRTDPDTGAVDQLQYDVGEGPCLAALREMRVVSVPSMRLERRWPHVAECAEEKGVRSSLSAPLVVGERGIGALNFYARTENAFSEEDEETAQTFALHAAVLLANAQAYWNAYELGQQLEQAMLSRASIEQAKGILIEQSGVTSDEAFELLRRASQRENRKLREIALEIVAHAQERRR
jgi:GAF domain-containing protein